MKPERIERIFGRGRVKMLTGDHVEVFREALVPGERRCYTKRFLETGDADFRQWTDREWRVLARLIGHGVRCVPDVAQYHGNAEGSVRQLQTYDAGISVDQWATLLPVSRDGASRRHVFEDCAHWWALAHHCLAALDEIHALQVVHLDLKADNICIPLSPTSFDPEASGETLHVVFGRLALIDFAFSLVSRENLTTALPIGWQRDYHYQSPRLLRALEAGRAGDLAPTQDLDWRCDLYSLAAMLLRFRSEDASGDSLESGWTPERHDDARALIRRLRECHDHELTAQRPHRDMMALTAAQLAAPDLAQSLARGWALAYDVPIVEGPSMVTPMTRIVVGPVSPTRLTFVRASTRVVAEGDPTVFRNPRSAPLISRSDIVAHAASATPRRPKSRIAWIASAGVAMSTLGGLYWIAEPASPVADRIRDVLAQLRMQSPLERPVTGGPPAVRAGAAGEASARTTDKDPALENGPQAPSRESAPSTPAQDARADKTASSADTKTAATDVANSKGVASQTRDAKASVPEAPAKAAEAPHPDKTFAPESDTKPPSTAVSQSQRPFTLGHAGPANARTASTGTAKKQASRSTAAPSQPRVANTTTAQAQPIGASSRFKGTATRFAWASYDPPPRSTSADSTSTQAASSADGARDTSPVATPQAVAAGSSGSAASTSSVASATPLAQKPASTTARDSEKAESAPTTVRSQGNASAPERAVTAIPRSASPPPSTASKSSAQDPWHAGLESLFRALGVVSRRTAPIEDRTSPAPKSTDARPPAASASRDTPVLENISSPEPIRPAAPPPPVTLAQAAVPSAEAAPLPTRAQPILSPPRFVSPPEPVVAAPSTPAVNLPAPIQLPAPVIAAADPRATAVSNAEVDLGDRARRMLSGMLPRVAEQARADASEVLIMATTPEPQLDRRTLIDTTRAQWRSERLYYAAAETAAQSRDLHDAARQAFASERKAEALDLELRAFAANPRSPDIAGFLAFLHLEQRPAQAETARQLALYALAVSGSLRSARIDDWNTFAVASALTGRDLDARRAFLVELALSGDGDRTCRAVRRAYEVFGEPLRDSLDGVLSRLSRGREPPACARPMLRMAAGSQ